MQHESPNRPEEYRGLGWSEKSALAFLILLFTFLITTYFVTPNMTNDQRYFAHLTFALLAGFAATFLGGTALLRLSAPKNNFVKLSLSATAGIAIFVFAYAYPPYWYVVRGTGDDKRLQASDGSLVISSVRTGDRSFPAVIDIIVRNPGSNETVIHKAELIILETTAEPPPHPDGLPVSMQYNALMTPSDKQVPIELAQGVRPAGIDRFQISIVLGRSESGVNNPWGSAIVDRADEALVVHSKMRLRLTYNEGQHVESDIFNIAVGAPAFGFKAKKIAGAELDQKLSLLSDQDISTVESVVRLLRNIGGPDVLRALRKLQAKDLTALRDQYAREMNKMTQDEKEYFQLPTPDERLRNFRQVLADAIDDVEHDLK